MKVRVSMVQPLAVWGEGESANAANAVRYLEDAARTGAQLVCFPEGYPGPAHGPLDSGGRLSKTPIEMVAEKARELGVYVAASNVEENPDLPNTYFLCQKLISPRGEVIADHRRVQPDEPELNEYLFNYRRDFVPGDHLTVVDTELGKIGLLICSELFVPELARIEMLMGAEIIIAPVNGAHAETGCLDPSDPPLWDTWRCMARARAAENLVYVLVTSNIFVDGYKGIVCAASPEKMLAASGEVGIVTTELDMDRLRWLRGHIHGWDYMNGSYAKAMGKIATRPGQQVLRRPEIYGKLVEKLDSDFDYWYFLKQGKRQQNWRPLRRLRAQPHFEGIGLGETG